MGIIVFLNILISGSLIAGLVAAVRMRHGGRSIAVLWALGAALVLLTVNVLHFRVGANRVIGAPSSAQVTGTWIGDYGSKLVLRPDGTFTAYTLPSQVGDEADTSILSGPHNPWSGHGTWVVRTNRSPESVHFTVACAAIPDGCAGHPGAFDLLVETNSPNMGGGPALFYYVGSPRDLSIQYSFVSLAYNARTQHAATPGT
jgi:hypothetical protein